jgi:hypothetical protein
MKKMLLSLSFCLVIAGCASSTRTMSESEVLAFAAEMRSLSCSDLAVRKSEYHALWSAGHDIGRIRAHIADPEFNKRCKK